MIKKITNKIFSLKRTSLGAFVKSIIIILLGLGIFYIDDQDFFNYKYTVGIIICISFLKCLYFLRVSYHKILEVSLKNTAYYEFIIFMALNIIVMVISFATDFFCLCQVDPNSLKGVDLYSGIFEKIFDCFYFSMLNFSFFGYGDILPATIPAKIVMMFETMISFLAIILVLSDFISLKESISEKRKLN
jgi:hypothetical protein